MKIQNIIACGVLALVALGAQAYAANQESENRQKMEISALPNPVQETIQDNLGGGTIVQVAKVIRGGETYYEAVVQKPGGAQMEIKVAEGGKLIEIGKKEEDNDDDGD